MNNISMKIDILPKPKLKIVFKLKLSENNRCLCSQNDLKPRSAGTKGYFDKNDRHFDLDRCRHGRYLNTNSLYERTDGT